MLQEKMKAKICIEPIPSPEKYTEFHVELN